jgi:hypothetical protein
MNKWFKSIFAGLAMTGLVFLFYRKILSPPGKPALYNVHYVLAGRQTQNMKEDRLGEAPALIKKRISDLGYNSVIRIIKENKLDIQVENVHDTASLRQVVAEKPSYKKIELKEVYTLDELPALFGVADEVSGKVFISAKRKEVGIYSIISPLAPDEIGGKNVFPPAVGSVNKKDTAILNRILEQTAVLQAVPEDLQFYYGILTLESAARNTPDDIYLYAIRSSGEKATIQNGDIERAELQYNSNDQPVILLSLNDRGAGKWAAILNKIKGRYIAVTLDRVVASVAIIHNTISNRWLVLNGMFIKEDAVAWADQLNKKQVIADLVIIKEEISSKNTGGRINLTLLLSLTFVIVTGLALFIFNNLKNR